MITLVEEVRESERKTGKEVHDTVCEGKKRIFEVWKSESWCLVLVMRGKE
jgi:hypothetical protein